MKKLNEVVCGLLCGAALFSIMTLTFFDVLGRKLLSHSIPGSLEMTELLMVIVIFAGLPLVSQRGEHVVFDSLDSVLPPWVRKMQQWLVHLLCGGEHRTAALHRVSHREGGHRGIPQPVNGLHRHG